LLRIDFEQHPSHDVLADKLNEFKELVAHHEVVIFSDYGKGGLTHIPTMIAAARAAGCRVLVDPKGDEYTRYQGADIITPNRSELRDVVGGWSDEAQLTAKAQALRASLGIEALLVTRSEEGMSLYREAATLNVPTVAREVFDVSGAGDTVISTLAVALGAGEDIEDAVRLANRAAGIVVGKLGTAVVTADELWQKESTT
jgi:rfaE bifunctional protein kinase chain/domain